MEFLGGMATEVKVTGSPMAMPDDPSVGLRRKTSDQQANQRNSMRLKSNMLVGAKVRPSHLELHWNCWRSKKMHDVDLHQPPTQASDTCQPSD